MNVYEYTEFYGIDDINAAGVEGWRVVGTYSERALNEDGRWDQSSRVWRVLMEREVLPEPVEVEVEVEVAPSGFDVLCTACGHRRGEHWESGANFDGKLLYCNIRGCECPGYTSEEP